MCYDADVFNPLTFTEESKNGVKCNVWFFNRKLRYCKIIETSKNKFVHYQSTIVKRKRQRNHGVEEVKKKESNTTLRRSRRAMKRTHFDEILHYVN